MSLFSSLQMAGNTLQAMQIGLHVVGNNIANANTPGYVREKAVYTPAPVQKLGSLSIGLGVEIAGIVQNIDKFAEQRLRDAGGDRAGAEVEEATYRDLEVLLNSLGDSNVSAKLTDFFNSVNEINNSPENPANKNLAISAGQQLTAAVNTLNREVGVLSDDLNTRVDQIASEINTLTEEIRQLNLRIVSLEGGGASGSDAGGLRSQRGVALKRLAQIVDADIVETDTGVTNVSVNGQFLVFEATRREVVSQQLDDGENVVQQVVFADNGGEIPATGGELGGIYESRDTILGDFVTGFNDFAAALAFEFNKVYSQGQGEEGYTSLTGTYRVQDATAALDQAGLDFTPVNGEFTVLITDSNEEDATPKSHVIDVDLLGSNGAPTTLTSLAEALDAISGITASVSIDNQLVINSESPANIQFSFENDSSGALAALGINTFFTGSDAASLGVNSELTSGIAAGAKFSDGLRAASDGLYVPGTNALRLYDLQDQLLESQDGKSLGGLYQQLIDLTTQGATTTASVAEGLRTFEGTLEAAAASVSGVNLDEEAIDMIQLQRAYQASARYIGTISELLDILVNL